jgi:hypothetical protein
LYRVGTEEKELIMAKKLIALLTLLALGGVAGTDQCVAELFPAVSKEKTGYINQEGKLLIPCMFEDGGEFSQGLAAVLVDGKWGYINEKAEIVLKPLYQDAGNFVDDMAWVQVKGKYGYINREGKVVVEPQYRRAGTFSEGYAVVENGRGKTTLIDKTGKAALNPDVYGMDISGFSEGLVFGYAKENRFPVYMDKDGKIAVRIETKDMEGFVVQGAAFSEGLAAVKIKGNWGYIDRTGKMIIAPEYWKVTPFQQGIALVAVMEMKGSVGHSTDYLIDRNGTKIKQLPATSGKLSEGLIPFGTWDKAKEKGLYGYMDTRGEIAIQPQFDNALPFRKGLAQVWIHEVNVYVKHGVNAYVDRQGQPVWIGEARGDERVTSYSGKSMVDMYRQTLREESWQGEGNWRLAQCYIQKMTRKELVDGSRITLEWLLQDPKRSTTTDFGRGGVIGMVAVAPFFQTYCRSFAKEQKPIDPSPFRSMLIDRSLDIDFRRELADLYRHHSFYTTSWEQLAEDTEVLNKLVRDPLEDEMLRSEAAQTNFALILRLYSEYRHDTIKDDATTGDKKAAKPDIVGMLGEIPCPFTPVQKAHWELVVNSMEKGVAGALTLYTEARSERTKKSVYGFLKEVPDYHLLRDKESLKRIREIQAERERVETKGGLNAR